MEWLAEEPSEKATSAITTFNVKPSSILTHSEENLERSFVEYENTLIKYDESGVHVGCPTGKIVIVSTQVKELYTANPENQKSITISKTIYADGSPPLPPIVISPVEKIMESWVNENL
ncbi:hypothetical protein L873DRAFT_1791349 [Choiromyces venosus 120613-1]|uniref:Uncharacterized protein n=1 Tax=Choiromyces venosus 120613-1 TaxID=1336337 RepID=A0A3N4JF70_9PEZI|nr:hypothetical protein L873DRAFT_1791349 [Choiromyces venosus 120613-1]